MSAADIEAMYLNRATEIDEYLNFVEQIEKATQSGIPKLGDPGEAVTVLQQQMLYANVYLHLYNLVEATVSQCLLELGRATSDDKARVRPGDLIPPVLEQWVRYEARTNVDMGPDKRLKAALGLAEQLIGNLPISNFEIQRGGGGNWDDVTIEKVVTGLGCSVKLSRKVRRAIKQPVRDDLGALQLVKSLRNSLAHGSISFGECGASVTAGELRDLAESVMDYLSEVVESFVKYLDESAFLGPSAPVEAK